MPEKMVRAGSHEVELWTEMSGRSGQAFDPVILLVMGANASGLVWPDELVQRLVAAGYRVLRYDHRDTGRSTKRDFAAHPYSVADLAADAVAVLDGHGVATADVVGFSMGGTIAQVLAIEHRERLRTVTLMATAALDVDFVGNLQRALAGEPSPDGLPTPDAAAVRALALRAREPRTLEEAIERRVAEWRVLAGDELPFDAEEFRERERRAIEHARTFEQPRAHALAAPVPLERGAELRHVTTPTLVVQAGRDPLNPAPHGRHLAELIPGARLVEIAGMGHALPGAVLGQLADAILGHIRPMAATSTVGSVVDSYLEYLMSSTFIDEAVARHGVATIVDEITRRVDQTAAPDAMLLARDLAVYGVFRQQLVDEVRGLLPRSGLFAALERCLEAPVFNARHGAVYTFGKLGFEENVPRLLRAFDQRRDRDPFLVPGLVFEIGWLQGDPSADAERVQAVIASSCELTRWSALAIIDQQLDDERGLEVAERLLEDPHALIRAEAAYRVAWLSRRLAARGLDSSPAPVTAQERRTIEASRPPITFDALQHRFCLAPEHAPDYSVDEVMAYLARLPS